MSARPPAAARPVRNCGGMLKNAGRAAEPGERDGEANQGGQECIIEYREREPCGRDQASSRKVENLPARAIHQPPRKDHGPCGDKVWSCRDPSDLRVRKTMALQDQR